MAGTKKTVSKKPTTAPKKSGGSYKVVIPPDTKYLIIHESPTEARTIRAFLPKGYVAMSTLGHFMSSDDKTLGINEETWEVELKPDRNKKDNIENIKEAIDVVRKNNGLVYIVTDPDREGEVIGSEVVLNFKLKKGEYKHPHITSLAEKEYMQGLREADDDLNWNMVEAGMTRQLLDKYVGFKFTEILWKLADAKHKTVLTNLSESLKTSIDKFKLRNKEVYEKNNNIRKVIDGFEAMDLAALLNFKERLGISIGRVQTPTLRLLVEKELEKLEKDLDRKVNILAIDDKKLEWSFDQNASKETDIDFMSGIFSSVKDAFDNNRILSAKVIEVSENIKNINPPGPLDTQQAQTSINSTFGYNLKQIMSNLQTLYEGGYTTYMRTDAIEVPESYRVYLKNMIVKSGSSFIDKNYTSGSEAQAGHHAILPTKEYNLKALPVLDPRVLNVFEYVLRRSAAAFMEPAKVKYVLYTMEVIYKASDGNNYKVLFNIKDSEILEKGYMEIFNYDLDNYTRQIFYKKGEVISIKDIILKEKEIKLPGSYSEGSIVKELKNMGIGRPSTWETIISTLKEKNYISGTSKMDITPKGLWTYQTIKEDQNLFGKIFDLKFTSDMESWLDEIAKGKKTRKDILPLIKKQFEDGFELLKSIKRDEGGTVSVSNGRTPGIALEEKCPKCGLPLEEVTFKSGKKAKKCTGANYDVKKKQNIGCDFIEWINDAPKAVIAPEIVTERKCPLCESDLVKVVTKTGKKMIKCSTQTWSPGTGVQGCTHVEWINE